MLTVISFLTNTGSVSEKLKALPLPKNGKTEAQKYPGTPLEK